MPLKNAVRMIPGSLVHWSIGPHVAFPTSGLERVIEIESKHHPRITKIDQAFRPCVWTRFLTDG